ncbi:hypothetical protein GCG21_15655 [Pseudactinotalea sp. HY160]|uniref:hypothetical protein n=1 Tax=Pseudactinotalea sp. HY160 TaxID=2654490 RepID=UPI00128DC0A0|nr:hypothetical protein [Pseudactinotalea sp. HY160]MPV51420.1 hypothetical protein [Pseudactinotalea sp. HY160]
MPLPLVPAVIGLGAAAAAGVAAGVQGVRSHVQARHSRREVVKDHAEAVEQLILIQARTDQIASDYGQRMFSVQSETLGHLVRWLEAHEKAVRRLDGEVVDGIELRIPELRKLKFDLEHATSGALGLVTAGGAGLAAQAAALWGVGALASAGTGTAISSLSGAAAQNAVLAWLGGGTLAAGGTGMAGGVIVLAFIAAVPTVAVAGLTIAWSGARQRRKTAEHEAQARVQIASMSAAGQLATRVGERVNELRDVLGSMSTRTEDAISDLEAVNFDHDDPAHARLLLRTVQLCRALREILNVPVIDTDGQLTDESVEIVARYR